MERSTLLLVVAGLGIAGFFALAPALPIYPLLVSRYGNEPIDALTSVLGLMGLVALVAGVSLRKFERLSRKAALYETAEFITMGTFGFIWISLLRRLNGIAWKTTLTIAFFLVYALTMEVIRRKLNPNGWRPG